MTASAAAEENAPASEGGGSAVVQNRYPRGIPFIVGNEAAERFSFYGMRAILAVHLKALFLGFAAEQTLPAATVAAARAHATELNHTFIAGVYAFPMIGAVLADRLAGKYRVILWVSLIYCMGHAVLSGWQNTLIGMMIGLSLIAIGSGGIKPCVSANVGDQFTESNKHLIRNVYLIFYFSINFGSFFATLLIPKLLDGFPDVATWPSALRGLGELVNRHHGADLAFGVPGVLMLIATVIFFLGRNRFVKVPAKPGGLLGLLDTLATVGFFTPLAMFFFAEDMVLWQRLLISVAGFAVGAAFFAWRLSKSWDDGFLGSLAYGLVNPDKKQGPFFDRIRQRFGEEAAEGPVAVFKIMAVFISVSVFWALFDQHSSTWVFQAEKMKLDVDVLGVPFHLSASQISALNPLMVMLLIPFLGGVVYPTLARFGIEPTPLRRMTAGMFIASLAFVAVALLQNHIDGMPPQSVPVMWQIIPYLVMTTSEVLVSATGLEFAYTQAPRRMKSTIMSFWLLTVSLGNKLVAVLAGFEGLEAEMFFWVFAGLMGFAALLFAVLAYFYKGKTYMQA